MRARAALEPVTAMTATLRPLPLLPLEEVRAAHGAATPAPLLLPRSPTPRLTAVHDRVAATFGVADTQGRPERGTAGRAPRSGPAR